VRQRLLQAFSQCFQLRVQVAHGRIDRGVGVFAQLGELAVELLLVADGLFRHDRLQVGGVGESFYQERCAGVTRKCSRGSEQLVQLLPQPPQDAETNLSDGVGVDAKRCRNLLTRFPLHRGADQDLPRLLVEIALDQLQGTANDPLPGRLGVRFAILRRRRSGAAPRV
jgi:hypothetical protein